MRILLHSMFGSPLPVLERLNTSESTIVFREYSFDLDAILAGLDALRNYCVANNCNVLLAPKYNGTWLDLTDRLEDVTVEEVRPQFLAGEYDLTLGREAFHRAMSDAEAREEWRRMSQSGRDYKFMSDSQIDELRSGKVPEDLLQYGYHEGNFGCDSVGIYITPAEVFIFPKYMGSMCLHEFDDIGIAICGEITTAMPESELRYVLNPSSEGDGNKHHLIELNQAWLHGEKQDIRSNYTPAHNVPVIRCDEPVTTGLLAYNEKLESITEISNGVYELIFDF